MGEFELVEVELDYVISGFFMLSEDFIEAFNKDYVEDGVEVIWAINNYDFEIICFNKVLMSMNWSDYWVINGGWGEYYKCCIWNQFLMSYIILKQVGWMDENFGIIEVVL